jgi:uncharacterized damage-inducible protein DinB
MSATVTTLLETPPGYRSREVARFLWQLDEQRRQLIDGTRGLSPADLAWQPAPGMNTIGMLLAHIAFAEVHVVQVGIAGEATGHAQDVLGITEADEGLPLPPGAPPSPALHGKPLAFFDVLLVKARDHTRAVCRELEDADLARVITRPPRPDGTVRVFNPGWVLYHLLEHEAGHRGQILLLKHLRSSTAA